MGTSGIRSMGVTAGLAAIAGLAGACGPVSSGGTRAPAAVVHLVAFDSCSAMLDTVRSEALREVSASGLPAGVAGYAGAFPGALKMGSGATRMAESAPAAAGSAGATPTASPAPADASGAGAAPDAGGFSTTNDQEAGVDEPDLAKTDGRLLVTIRRDAQALQVADVSATPPRLRGSLGLADVVAPNGLFLVGSDAVVLGPGPGSPTPVPEASGSTSGGGMTAPIEAQSPTTVVAVVSLSDPDRPVLRRSFTLQGAEVDARLVAGRIEVVVASGPRLPFVAPTDGSAQSNAAALALNTELIRSSTPADWLPSVTSEPDGTTHPAACTSAMHPDVASGLGTVSVVPIDPSAAAPGAELTVVGNATTVYASTSSLYVATTSWSQQTGGGVEPMAGAGAVSPAYPVPATPAATDIHGFDLSDPGAPKYLGSGEVAGTLIGQYALSEYQGYLRVATTVGDASPPPSEGTAPATLSDSRVTILQPQDGALVLVGSVGGLGSGEKIYAVRFLGPLGYVVTFRQTDPLYVLDLSDPHHPQTTGQLELDGYSSFLEPLPDGRLLGIGQAVDPNLRTNGLQLSLFDVSDPAHPALLSKDVLAGGWSAAQDDPHALLWWGPAHLAVLPVQQQPQPTAIEGDGSTPGAYFDGAVAFRVTDSALSEAGRVTQPPAEPQPAPVAPGASQGTPSPGTSTVPAPPDPSVVIGGVAVGAGAVAVGPGGSEIERELVVGSMLYTVSESGIMASDLTSFQPLTWMAYS